MFFIGSYEFHTDEAGRIRMPISLRDDLGDDLYIGLGSGDYLVVYPKEEYQKMMEVFASTPRQDNRKWEKIRAITSNLFPFKYDNQARYQIPQKLRELVDVSGDVTIVGNVNLVEIWPSATYNEIALQKDTPRSNLFGGLDGI